MWLYVYFNFNVLVGTYVFPIMILIKTAYIFLIRIARMVFES